MPHATGNRERITRVAKNAGPSADERLCNDDGYKQIANPRRGRRALDQITALGDADMIAAVNSFHNQLPTDDPELIAASVKLKAKARGQSGVQQERSVQFSRWKRKDGRSAELALLRIEGNVVEFCTRDGQLRELTIEVLSDDDQARLAEWHRQQLQ